MEKLIVLIAATICHQVNKAWCEANGDTSQKDWSEAEQWQRDSAIKGVEFRLNNPKAGKDAQHNAWMQDKINDGWVYGEKKDAEAKTHPCILPFDQLPEFQQKKDALFCAVVDALKDKPEAELKEVVQRNITFGEFRVGISFNPGGHELVNSFKTLAARAIDNATTVLQETSKADIQQFKNLLADESEKATEFEAKRCFEIAGKFLGYTEGHFNEVRFDFVQEDIETAAMYAVKGATKPLFPDYLK